MKKTILLLLFIPGLFFRGSGQVTIYSENFGTGTSLPAGWTATTGSNTWMASTGSSSSGYAGASGGTNVVATNGSTLNTYYLTCSNNLSTVGYTTITVLWGARRTSTFSNAVTFEWSTDGITWIPVTYTQVASNSTWALVNTGIPISLPAAAEGAANLQLRWSYTQVTGSGTYRIDDLNVQGNLNSQAITYTWQGPDGGDWTLPSNWNPSRMAAASNDILQFDYGTAKNITNVITQSIGQLLITNSSSVTLQSTGPAVLTITGGTGNDLVVTDGSHLNLNGADALSISLNTGSNGSISGDVLFTTGGHKLLAADDSSVVFIATGMFTAGAGFTGNPFGTSSLNSVVFGSGSSYHSQSGSNPFGASAPNSVVVFQPGSLYVHEQSGSLSFSGRTYGNFELNYPSTFSQSGSGAVSIGNLTISTGTLNFNLTGPSSGTHSIKGNITIAVGHALNFNPSSPGNVTFNGLSVQVISGAGTFSNSVNSTLTVNNSAGVSNSLNNPLILNGNLSVSGGSFIISPYKSMEVNGTLTINIPEGLVLSSDSTGTGSLIGNTITGTGTVRIERFIPGWTSSTDGWHFLSSPVYNQLIDPDFTDPDPAGYDFYKWDESSMTWLNQKVSSNNITSFSSGEGYLAAYATTSVKKFSGTLNNADLLLTNLSYTPSNSSCYGWHLLGNPFSCAIHWNDGNWGLTHVAGIAKVLNSGGTYTDLGPGSVIPAMNGFLVQVLEASNAITIPKSARINDSLTGWYKANSADSNRLVLTASTLDDNTYSECVIRFDPGSASSYEPDRDSHFIAGMDGTPQLYSIIQNDTSLSTNVLPQVLENKTIKLGFRKGVSGNYTLSANGTESFASGTTITLEDLKTGQTQDLAEDPDYAFSSFGDDDPQRFLLHFGTTSVIEDRMKSDRVTIYSVMNSIFITKPADLSNAVVSVYNLQGQELKTQPLKDQPLNIIQLNQPAGYYIARVITGNLVTRKTFFIN
jgi:hypothetical protein